MSRGANSPEGGIDRSVAGEKDRPILRNKVLSCSFFPTEKRAKYDNGEDPLDPEAQSGGGHQWHQGGFPFGEGFQFKFHFN